MSPNYKLCCVEIASSGAREQCNDLTSNNSLILIHFIIKEITFFSSLNVSTLFDKYNSCCCDYILWFNSTPEHNRGFVMRIET